MNTNTDKMHAEKSKSEDHEMQVINLANNAIEQLEAGAKKRVLEYLVSRHVYQTPDAASGLLVNSKYAMQGALDRVGRF